MGVKDARSTSQMQKLIVSLFDVFMSLVATGWQGGVVGWSMGIENSDIKNVRSNHPPPNT